MQEEAQHPAPGPELAHARLGQAAVAVPQVQRDAAEEGISLGQVLGQAIMASPQLMADQAQARAEEIGRILASMAPHDPLLDCIHEVYWGFGHLILDLRRMPEGEQTTDEQRRRGNDLAQQWAAIQADIVARNEVQARRALARARDAAQTLRLEMLHAYHSTRGRPVAPFSGHAVAPAHLHRRQRVGSLRHGRLGILLLFSLRAIVYRVRFD